LGSAGRESHQGHEGKADALPEEKWHPAIEELASFVLSMMGLLLVSTASLVGIVLDDAGDPYRISSLYSKATASTST
jgi:hypothetical protein